MKTLLVINASGRVTRSITRALTGRFSEAWLAQNPDGRIVERDVGQNSPPGVDELWIAGAFSAPADRTAAQKESLRLSEVLIDELDAAHAVVIGAPIYNFGLPAQLKAYFDQIVRVGRTFAFMPGSNPPYQPMLKSKPVIVVSSAGDGSLHPGGPMAHLNFLEPHLKTLLEFVGQDDVTFVRVGFEEFADDRFKHSMAAAEVALDRLAGSLLSA